MPAEHIFYSGEVGRGKKECLRVEDHPAHAKNSGLLTQKLLAASNGELYTAM